MRTKQFMADNRVFADAFNFLLYGGAPVIRPERLRELDTGQTALVRKRDGREKGVEKTRDLLKELVGKEDGERAYLILGIENQTDVHYAMPVRNMMYNAMSYEKQVKQKAKEWKAKEERGQGGPEQRGSEQKGQEQREPEQKGLREKEQTKKVSHKGAEYLSGFGKADKLLPVITLVVYFGSGPWDGPTSLHEMLEIKDERIVPWVNDYKLHLLTPEGLGEEDFERFHSELGPVLRYIRCSGDREKMEELTEREEMYRSLSHEAAELLNSCAGFKLKINEEEEKVDMRNAWDEHFDDGVAKGLEQGISRGRQEGRKEGRASMFQEMADMLSKNMSLEQIARQLNMELPAGSGMSGK